MERPRLIRTLSTQHWVSAKNEMEENKKTQQWAGSALGGYEYWIVKRDNVTFLQTFKNGELIQTDFFF